MVSGKVCDPNTEFMRRCLWVTEDTKATSETNSAG